MHLVILFEDVSDGRILLICRRFDFPPWGARVLLPQVQMVENAFYDVGFMNEADDSHLMTASRRTKRVYFPDLSDEPWPSSGRNPPQPML